MPDCPFCSAPVDIEGRACNKCEERVRRDPEFALYVLRRFSEMLPRTTARLRKDADAIKLHDPLKV